MPAKQKKPVDHATAVPKKAMTTKKEKIDGAREQIGASQTSPGWAAAPAEVTGAATAWSKATDDVDTNDKAIVTKLAELEALRVQEPVLLRRWASKKRGFFGSINNYADGSKDTVTGLACAVQIHQALPLAGFPGNVHDLHSKVRGTAAVGWDTMNGKYEFMVQFATDTANPATFTEPAYCTAAKYKLPGQTPGATLQARVLTLDAKLPNGKSPYSPWVPVVVGA